MGEYYYVDALKQRYTDEDWATAKSRYDEYCKEIIKDVNYDGDFIIGFEYAINYYNITYWKDFFKGLKKKLYE